MLPFDLLHLIRKENNVYYGFYLVISEHTYRNYMCCHDICQIVSGKTYIEIFNNVSAVIGGFLKCSKISWVSSFPVFIFTFSSPSPCLITFIFHHSHEDSLTHMVFSGACLSNSWERVLSYSDAASSIDLKASGLQRLEFA